jgi:hypothetical protein
MEQSGRKRPQMTANNEVASVDVGCYGARVVVGAESAACKLVEPEFARDRQLDDAVHAEAFDAQKAFAADFHSPRRCAMSWARSSSLPPSTTWRSDGSARR